MVKILIYGFKPWGKFKENITEKVLVKIRNRKNIKKVVFNVEFNKSQFINEIVKFNPEVIIGLGQCSQGDKLRIERKAINLEKNKLKEDPKPIFKNGLQFLFSTLKIKNDNQLKMSYNAGKYVCNYSMYVIADFIKDRNIKSGFIHVPKEYNVKKATKQIEGIIKTFEK